MRRSALILVCTVWAASLAAAAPMSPRAVKFAFAAAHTDTARTCNLTIAISNLPHSEALNFRLVYVIDKGEAQGSLGFSLDVFQSKQQVALTSAAVTAADFTTVGRFTNAMWDEGGIFAVGANAVDQKRLLKIMSLGNYDISFQQAGTQTPRSYHVSEPASTRALQSMTGCMQSANAR